MSNNNDIGFSRKGLFNGFYAAAAAAAAASAVSEDYDIFTDVLGGGVGYAIEYSYHGHDGTNSPANLERGFATRSNAVPTAIKLMLFKVAAQPDVNTTYSISYSKFDIDDMKDGFTLGAQTDNTGLPWVVAGTGMNLVDITAAFTLTANSLYGFRIYSVVDATVTNFLGVVVEY